MSGLRVRNAVVRYGPVTAVDDVDLDVAPGEILALLGGSGSGKSSLLRAIAGLEPLAAGTVSWDGVDLAGTPVHKRGVGLMFQDGQLFPHLSVAGNVGYGLYRLPRAQRAARVAELLDLVGLAGYGDRPVTALSGGQAQRVALARSLAPEPKLLLLDEPLAALDRGLRERLVDVLADGLRATHTTALYVTHDQDEAFSIADRVGMLADGRLIADAPAEELWRHPPSREVAEFLGYGPFVSADTAAALGLSAIPDDRLVGLGIGALVADPSGVEVAVTSQRHQRGRVEVEVVLPDGQPATLLAETTVAGPTVVVRLDPDAVVTVPAAADANRSHLASEQNT